MLVLVKILLCRNSLCFFARDEGSGLSTIQGQRILHLMTSWLASSLEDPAATLISEISQNSWSSAALLNFLRGGSSSEILNNDWIWLVLFAMTLESFSTYYCVWHLNLLILHKENTIFLSHPGSGDLLYYCLDLHDLSWVCLHWICSELDVPDGRYPLLSCNHA